MAALRPPRAATAAKPKKPKKPKRPPRRGIFNPGNGGRGNNNPAGGIFNPPPGTGPKGPGHVEQIPARNPPVGSPGHNPVGPGGAGAVEPVTPTPPVTQPVPDVIPTYADLLGQGQNAFTGLLTQGNSLAAQLYQAALRYGGQGAFQRLTDATNKIRITNPNYHSALIDADPSNDYIEQSFTGGPALGNEAFSSGPSGERGILQGSQLWDVAKNRMAGRRRVNEEHLLGNTLFSGNRLLDQGENEEAHNAQVIAAQQEFDAALARFIGELSKAQSGYDQTIGDLAEEGRRRYLAEDPVPGGGGEGAAPPDSPSNEEIASAEDIWNKAAAGHLEDLEEQERYGVMNPTPEQMQAADVWRKAARGNYKYLKGKEKKARLKKKGKGKK